MKAADTLYSKLNKKFNGYNGRNYLLHWFTGSKIT